MCLAAGELPRANEMLQERGRGPGNLDENTRSLTTPPGPTFPYVALCPNHNPGFHGLDPVNEALS